jgi:hypothetical protein
MSLRALARTACERFARRMDGRNLAGDPAIFYLVGFGEAFVAGDQLHVRNVAIFGSLNQRPPAAG